MPNQKLSKYEKHERDLGTYFIHSFPKEIKQAAFTPPNSYSTWDMWYSTWEQPDVSIINEIKVRNFEYTKYPDYILEVGKIKNLMKMYKQGKPINYINFFKNKKGFYDCIVFNLSARVKKWKKDNHIPTIIKSMNAATFKSKYDKVEKEVVMLSFDPTMDTLIQNTQWK